jgi:hypothetical protein
MNRLDFKPFPKKLDVENGLYTYADYLTWEFDERVELIKGKIFRMGEDAPKTIHQKISVVVSVNFYSFLKGLPCEIYTAPFDVRLPVKSKRNEDIDTVVQPDICVICDPAKLNQGLCPHRPFFKKSFNNFPQIDAEKVTTCPPRRGFPQIF